MNDIGFETALELAGSAISTLVPETVSCLELVGRVCACDIAAVIDYPTADSSLKDGYAVVSKDVESACCEAPIVLRVVGSIGAGDGHTVPVTSGAAVRVLSGALIPSGADAVLAEEFTEVGSGEIKAFACAEPSRNVMFKGMEISKGEILVRAGEVFTPAAVSLVVTGGIHEALVFRRPTVGLLATGDEVLLPGTPPEPGKLFAGNLALQDAWLRTWSLKTVIRRAGDSFEELTRAVESIIAECDVLITSGGAWKGDRDLIVKVLDSLGWNRLFHRVRLGPGKAVGMGILGEKPVFCLPGGPPSNEAAFLLIALPSVLRMAGYKGSPYVRLTGILEQDIGRQDDWTEVFHCRAERRDSGIHLIPLNRSRRLSTMARADALVVVPEGVKSIRAGDAVEFISLTS